MNCQYCLRDERTREEQVPGVEKVEFECGTVVIQAEDKAGLSPVWHQSQECRETAAAGYPAGLRAEIDNLKKQVQALAARADELGWFGAPEAR